MENHKPGALPLLPHLLPLQPAGTEHHLPPHSSLELKQPWTEASHQAPLMSMSCSSDRGWLLMGSVPFSAIYFSMSRRS